MNIKFPSIGTIIILVLGYNLFFSDDDEDTKNIEGNKNDGKSITQEVKNAVKEVKAEVIDIIKTAKEEFSDDICVEVTCYEHYGTPSNLPEPFIITGSIDNPTRIESIDPSVSNSYAPRGGNWLELKSKYDLDPDDDWESCGCTNSISRKEKVIVVENKKDEKISSNTPKKDTLPKLESINKESKNKKSLFRSID